FSSKFEPRIRKRIMRLFEVVFLALVAAAALCGPHFGQKRFALAIVCCLVIAAGLLPIWLEGFRWQMSPAYIALAFLLFLLYRLMRTGVSEEAKLPVGRMRNNVLILLGLAALLGTLVPIPNLPAPDGPYQVGTQSYRLVDSHRREVFCNQKSQLRE